MIAVSATVAVSAPEDVHYVEGAPDGHGPVVVLGAGGHRGVTVAACAGDADAAETWDAVSAAAARAAEFHRDRDGRQGGCGHGG